MAKKINKKGTKAASVTTGSTSGGSTEPIAVVSQSPIHIPIAKVSIDLGREDLNNLAIKINEIIDHLNG